MVRVGAGRRLNWQRQASGSATVGGGVLCCRRLLVPGARDDVEALFVWEGAVDRNADPAALPRPFLLGNSDGAPSGLPQRHFLRKPSGA